jgi:hypothetical protein
MQRTMSQRAAITGPDPQFDAYEKLTREAFALLSAGDDHPDRAVLREQLRLCTVTELHYQGEFGFFVRISVPPGAPRLSRDGEICDLQARDPSDPDRNPIFMFIKVVSGQIMMFEASPYDAWPADISNYKLNYLRWRIQKSGVASPEPATRREAPMWGPF